MNDLPDPVSAAEATEMLEKLFSLYGRRCSGCGALHEVLEQYGIMNLTEWEELVGYALCWVIEHKEAVRTALPGLDEKRGAHCTFVRHLLREVELRWASANPGEPARSIRVVADSLGSNRPEVKPSGWVFHFSPEGGPGVDDICFPATICPPCLMRLMQRHPRVRLAA
jgi:hypothetical protein